MLYAADVVDALQDRVLTENLRKVLRFGPEVGVHTIGWWRSPARLRSLLSMSASPDDLASFLALDVQGAELGPWRHRGCCPSGPRAPAGRSGSTGRGTPGRRS